MPHGQCVILRRAQFTLGSPATQPTAQQVVQVRHALAIVSRLPVAQIAKLHVARPDAARLFRCGMRLCCAPSVGNSATWLDDR